MATFPAQFRRRLLRAAGATLGAALLAGVSFPVRADPPAGKGWRKGEGGGGSSGGGREDRTVGALVGAALFSALEVQRIRSYYATRGDVRAKPLPPGIAKNLARGKPLPPGIAKRYAPRDLVGQLSSRSGYQILVAGASILLVEAASGVIRDIVEQAIGR